MFVLFKQFLNIQARGILFDDAISKIALNERYIFAVIKATSGQVLLKCVEQIPEEHVRIYCIVLYVEV